jgi:hypothetical protein
MAIAVAAMMGASSTGASPAARADRIAAMAVEMEEVTAAAERPPCRDRIG